jgi:hypothetical protein
LDILGLANDCGRDDSEDLSFMRATETEREVLLEIKRKFSSMPRSSFIGELSNEFSLDDMSEFRRSLYDLAVDVIPNTPVGKLIIRKDTTNSGNQLQKKSS